MKEGSDNKFLEAEKQVFDGYSLTPKARRIKLRKPALTLRVLELGSGEPALFLHGMGGAAVHWASLMSRLPSLHKIAIDMPGHGASDDVDFRGLELRTWYRDLLTGCLDELELESAHIVGHSMSAMFGMWLALDAPERVRSLIALGTPAAAFGEGRLPAFIRVVARPGIGAAAVLLGLAVLQVYRARQEEEVLETTFPEYRTYALRTPRFIPGCAPVKRRLQIADDQLVANALELRSIEKA